jgi:hypothetical protein
MIECVTTNTHRLVQLSDEDANLTRYCWYEKRSAWVSYIVRGVRVNGQVKTIRLHRLVAGQMGLELKGRQIHHRDRDMFNNTRENLESLPPGRHARMTRELACASSF